jgi:addiction module HigA family antidote
MAKLKNVHPGEVLLEEFIVPMSLSQNAVARAISVPPRRINEIVLGKRAITADSQGIPQGDSPRGYRSLTITGR